jgi:hypothetical protein
LRRLKSESPEIYVYLIWATKDYLEGVRNFENADIPPIKPHLACLQNAVKKLRLESRYDNYRNQLEILIPNQPPLIFINGKTRFNQQIVADICKDKKRTYNRLKNVIRTPRTMGFWIIFVNQSIDHI